ncbi:prolipoprotein diacylglyceryl transferase [Altererythrobacter ishigakiensis]|uniref:Phosphatidylglycerol--prolipoprotein diacylglyceryl transferase n=1 Tax=Altererythrobacter ishigakiensis TaxID=476157 RepID=A0A562UTD2_9SPHN|nr:prolipoprotein diacylglyceryl transferase [Altererythrobacter ishigakiensis]TWJ08892.1 phosphatidylglycerol:prolipoprotein diacylglycerol transferase [Altererythrobacter ishigakiensis]
MLSLLAATGAADPIYWADLGFTEGIDLGFFTLRFYSLAYLLGVLFAYWHVTKMIKQPGAPMAQRHVDDLFFYCTLGVILGGRLGYATFYRPELFTSFNGEGFVSWDLLRLWDGGMSFHGGLLGVMVAMMWVSWRGKLSFLRVTDYVSVGVPMGMMLGRLANFTNGELWGRATDVSWGMIFPGGGDVVRHPSQLYQAGLEGLLLLVAMTLLFWKTSARFRPGLLTGIFVTGISAARFINEFFREPDEHLADRVIETGLSQGQWLTIPLIVLGFAVIVYALRKAPLGSGGNSPAQA